MGKLQSERKLMAREVDVLREERDRFEERMEEALATSRHSEAQAAELQLTQQTSQDTRAEAAEALVAQQPEELERLQAQAEAAESLVAQQNSELRQQAEKL